MSRAETERGAARAAVLPVIVGIRDAQSAAVLGGVVIAVADEGGLVMVVEVGAAPCAGKYQIRGGSGRICNKLRDGDEVGAVRDIDQAVVQVLVGGRGRVELAVVDPNVCAILPRREYLPLASKLDDKS